MSAPCRTCSEPVDEGATACPNCGASVVAVGTRSSVGRRMGAVVGGVLFALVAFAVWVALGFTVGIALPASNRMALGVFVFAYNAVFIAVSVAAFNVGLARARRGDAGAPLFLIPAILMFVPTSLCAVSVFSGLY